MIYINISDYSKKRYGESMFYYSYYENGKPVYTKIPHIVNYLINNLDKSYKDLIMKSDLNKTEGFKPNAIPVAGTHTNGRFIMNRTCYYYLKTDVIKLEDKQ